MAPETLGGYLRELRETTTLSQVDVARSAGMSRATITRMEGDEEGSLSPGNVRRVLAALGFLRNVYGGDIERIRGSEFLEAMDKADDPPPPIGAPAEPDLLIKIGGDVLVPINVGMPFYWDRVPLGIELSFQVRDAVMMQIVHALQAMGVQSSVRVGDGRQARREVPPLDDFRPNGTPPESRRSA